MAGGWGKSGGSSPLWVRVQAGPAGNRDRQGLQMAHVGWTAIVKMMDWLCEHWDQPEEGIWETRGGREGVAPVWAVPALGGAGPGGSGCC